MALAPAAETNERRFCWEQVLRTNPLFRISQVFAPTDQASQLLPLYALFSAVEEINSECSDDDVARRKLDWWRNECSRLAKHGSNHPILRELVQSGAHQALCQDSLAQLFDNAESRLDAAAPVDLDQLRALCGALSLPQLVLETSLSGEDKPPPELVDGLGVEIGLAQLMRESVRRTPSRGYWWLPLNLLARHGLNRTDIARDPRATPVWALFKELLMNSGKPGLDKSAGDRPAALNMPAGRHLVVIGHLQAGALRRLHRSRPDQYATELNRIGLPQLYQAWKAARIVRDAG